uniref:Venom S1 protease 28 n=1 Tax=Platymeris rhadamanthus TaxID=1134088 RepID=A0A6B9L3R8_PLARH|nr:venom S1 protease 28 [Platymeris rhadamanthus]
MKIMIRLYSLIFVSYFLCFSVASPADEVDSSEHGVTPGNKATTCKCGWANKVGRRIIGGSDAGKNEWPMMAGIIVKNPVNKVYMHMCGGTIITNWHIVTAGHCIYDESGIPKKETELGVILGAHSLKEVDYENPEVLLAPKKLIAHPKYIWPSTYDIAIILMKKFEFSNIIGPACLPIKRFDFVGSRLKVIGWGDIDHRGTIPDILKKSTLNGVDTDKCSFYGDLFDKADHYQMCTFQEDRSGQCVGDSGGPVLWNDPETNRFTLVALPSFGYIGCVIKPAVCTDVTYFLPWIQEVVSSTQPEARTCSKQ